MLLLEQGVLRLEPRELSQRALLTRLRSLNHPRLDPASAHLAAPLRQHERVDLERLGNVLHPHPIQLRQLHRLELELRAVAPQFARTLDRGHLTSSSVRSECLLYRVKIPGRSNA